MTERNYLQVCFDNSEEERYLGTYLSQFEISRNINVLRVLPHDVGVDSKERWFLVGPNSFRVLGSLNSRGIPRPLKKREKFLVKSIGLKVSKDKEILQEIISGPRFSTKKGDFVPSRVSVTLSNGSWKTVKGNFIIDTSDYPRLAIMGVQENSKIRPLVRDEIPLAGKLGFHTFHVTTSADPESSGVGLRLSQLDTKETYRFQNFFPSSKAVLYREKISNFILQLGEGSLEVLGSYASWDIRPRGIRPPEDLTEKEKILALQMGLEVKERPREEILGTTGTCQYIYKRGENKGNFCGKSVEEENIYCNFCMANRAEAKAYLEKRLG